MKRIVCALLLAIPIPAAAADPELKAAVVSLVKDERGCFRTLGFVVQKPGETSRQLDDRIRKEFPDRKGEVKSIAWKDNVKKGRTLGTHVVVLRSKKEIKRDGSCSGIGYGIGWGTDEASAKKDALSNLGTHWIWFDERQHGVEVLLSEKR